jgi:glycosyltransferase involved in cell wall biosynthesis
MLAPFIDTSAYLAIAPDVPGRLVTVAMMRAGDKFASYRMLAESLAIIEDSPWSLAIVGSGPTEPEVRQLFRTFEEKRIDWLGEAEPAAIPALLSAGGIYVWPGFGEAYGLSYLEAQAAGLPVVAQHVAGVPEVVRHEVTGILTPPGDAAAYGAAIVSLITDKARRNAMRVAARQFVHDERSLPAASRALDRIIADAVSRC